MTAELVNDPYFSRAVPSVLTDMGTRLNMPTDYRAPMSEDEDDRLTLIAAAERYEGLDWTQFELLD